MKSHRHGTTDDSEVDAPGVDWGEVVSAEPVGGRPVGYSSPPGRHRHQCERCLTVWEHDTVLFARRGVHVCPNPDCRFDTGERRWPKYSGPLPPAYHDPGEGSEEDPLA
jgi:hypothetical protein